MSFPPPPQDPQGHGSSASSGFGSGPSGYGPPQGFGPAPGGPAGGHAAGPPPAGGGFGPPGSGAGGPGPGGQPPQQYGAPYGPPGFPGQPYGPPQPPGGGNRGAKVAAIVVGSVLAAALAVGGAVLLVGGDDGGSRTEATGESSPGAAEEPGPGAGDPSRGADEPAPESSSGPAPSSPADGLVPFVVLEPGQCFDHPALSSDVSVVETRSCDEPHNGEVITNDRLTGTFPDEQALRSKVMELCHSDVNDRLESMPSDGRMYYFYAIYPSLPTYRLGEDDTISCAITLSDSLDGPKLTAPLPG